MDTMKKTIKNKRKLRKGVKSILLLVLIAISISTVLSAFPTQEDHHAALGADGLLETTMAKIEALSPVYTPPPMLLTANDLICTNAILIEAEKNITLFEKNADTSVYPASVTKVLTALVALENIDNLNETVILQARDFESLYQAHASLSGFSEGDKLSYDDLLYSLMLVSGCDSAQALANNISGDNHSFSQLMNAKVDELQLRNSYFVNPSGLNHPDQYTTARDMAAIFSAALENQHFRQIIGSTVY
ncbi:MAG: serine hydrolase, partial [Clostridiales bacterium]